MAKQFLKFGTTRYDGSNGSGNYVYPFSVVTEDGGIIAEGELIGKPRSLRLPEVLKGKWIAPANYSSLGNRQPFGSQEVLYPDVPWFRYVD